MEHHWSISHVRRYIIKILLQHRQFFCFYTSPSPSASCVFDLTVTTFFTQSPTLLHSFPKISVFFSPPKYPLNSLQEQRLSSTCMHPLPSFLRLQHPQLHIPPTPRSMWSSLAAHLKVRDIKVKGNSMDFGTDYTQSLAAQARIHPLLNTPRRRTALSMSLSLLAVLRVRKIEDMKEGSRMTWDSLLLPRQAIYSSNLPCWHRV
jgi:hypothetical protein